MYHLTYPSYMQVSMLRWTGFISVEFILPESRKVFPRANKREDKADGPGAKPGTDGVAEGSKCMSMSYSNSETVALALCFKARQQVLFRISIISSGPVLYKMDTPLIEILLIDEIEWGKTVSPSA